jgi:hypothetical protein
VDTFKAKDVMSAPVTTFRHKEKVRNIVQTLISCRHHAFPVVLTPKDKVMLDSRNKCVALKHQPCVALFFLLNLFLTPIWRALEYGSRDIRRSWRARIA